MRNIRLIARLDIKGPNLIKGINLEGLRVIGSPQEHATRYYQQGVDELLYIDIVASLYQRNSLVEILKSATEDIFVPITVGGGVRSVDDADQLLRAGADKIAINTAAIGNPGLISDLSRRYGSQCVVVSIEAKRNTTGWEAYTDNGREHSGLDAIAWARQAEELGAGELLMTSIDQEGTRKGFDVALYQAVRKLVNIPVIASGGMGRLHHLVEVAEVAQPDAIAMADILHYGRATIMDVREYALQKGLPVRRLKISHNI